MSEHTKASTVQLFLDGELDQDHQKKLLAHVASCQQCSQLMEEEKTLKGLIASSGAFAGTASTRLHQAIAREMASHDSRPVRPSGLPGSFSFKYFPVMAALVLIAIGAAVLLPTFLHRASYSRTERAAREAYEGLERGSLQLDAQSSDPQALAEFFQSRLSFPFHFANAGIAADDRANYTLRGGRLLKVGSKTVAIVEFESAGHIVTMLVAPDQLGRASGGTIVHSGDITLHSQYRDLLHTVSWNNRGSLYVLTSRVSMANTQQCNGCHRPVASIPAITQASAPAPGDAKVLKLSYTDLRSLERAPDLVSIAHISDPLQPGMGRPVGNRLQGMLDASLSSQINAVYQSVQK